MTGRRGGKTPEDGPVELFPDLRALQPRYEYDVFLSYSRAQEAPAEELCTALEGRKVKTFFAPRALPRPDVDQETVPWIDSLQAALFGSCHCLCLLSPSYLASSWCQLEMHGFFNLGTDRDRQQWLFRLEDVGDELPAKFAPFLFPGPVEDLVARIATAVRSSPRKPGQAIAMKPRSGTAACFRKLPLDWLYGVRERRPWRSDGRAAAMAIGPSYAEYEGLVREYMVKILRGADRRSVWVDLPGLDERAKWVPKEARENACRLLDMGISPFLGTVGPHELLADVDQARAQGQTEPDLDCVQGLAYLRLGRHREAAAKFQAGLSRDPRDEAYWRGNLAMAHYLLGEYEQGLRVLGRTPRGRKDHLFLRAACLARLGKPRAARALAREGRRIDPSHDLKAEALQCELERNEDVRQWMAGLQAVGL